MQTAPSGTATSSTPAAWTSGNVTAPARRTAAPSTKVSISASVTGSPATSAAAIPAAPAGSTPTTRVPGACSRSQVAQPASSPPPPTGRTTTSGTRSSWARNSTATVAWPATVDSASNAGTTTAPVRAASSAATRAASS